MIAIKPETKPLAAGILLALTTLATGTAAAQRSVADDTLSGAAKGAVIGAIAGDAGKGAAAGAVGGNRGQPPWGGITGEVES